MENNLEIGAYLALIVLYQLQIEDDLTEIEKDTRQSLAHGMLNTNIINYENIDVAGLCFAIIKDYLREQSA